MLLKNISFQKFNTNISFHRFNTNISTLLGIFGVTKLVKGRVPIIHCIFLFFTIAGANKLKNKAQNAIFPMTFATFVQIFSGNDIKQSQLSQPIQHNRGKI